MLEIVILFVLCGKIGKIVESKSRNKIGYQLMLVGMWLGGEIFGGIVGGIIGAIAGESENSVMLFGVIGGLSCAIIGAVIAFQIAKNLQPLYEQDDFAYDIERADRLRAGDHFRDRDAVPPPPADAYTRDPDKPPRPRDDRFQE